MSNFVNDGLFIPDAPPKDPDSIIDYGLDWSNWLAADETINTSSWITSPTGLTIDSESLAATETLVFLSGGTVGVEYTLTNRIVTDQGRTEDRSMLIKCQQK